MCRGPTAAIPIGEARHGLRRELRASNARPGPRSHRNVIGRTNPYTGLAYRDDPTIFAWELANEPRRYTDAWIDDTAAFIKSLDPNHLVTTGSEGTPPWEQQDFSTAHDGPDIDYGTVHIWPQNWDWYDPADPSTYAAAEDKARQFLLEHAAAAAELGKPLVLEEFGLARDPQPQGDPLDPASPTTYRDRFLAAMFAVVEASAASGGALAGDNLWAWSGAARPGDPWVGDPPHELAGWYSVYDSDDFHSGNYRRARRGAGWFRTAGSRCGATT